VTIDVVSIGSRANAPMLAIYGGPLHGKSTAHEAGIVHDSETLPPAGLGPEITVLYQKYKKVEEIWKHGRNASDMDLRNERYNDYVIALMATDIPVISSHYNDDISKAAKAAGRSERFVSIDWFEIMDRIAKTRLNSDKPKLLLEVSLTVRAAGAFGYKDQLWRSGIPWRQTYPTYGAALVGSPMNG